MSNDDCVICPACAHEFVAIPVSVQERLAQGEPDQRFINLLCRIHRDGGHYIAEHGLDRAAADADVLVAELFSMCGEPPAPEAKQEPVIRYNGLYEYAATHQLDYNELCQVVREASRPAPVNTALLEARK